MAGPAYTLPLWSLANNYTAGPGVVSPTVPAGNVWVVRDVALTYNPGVATLGAQHVTLMAADIPICSTPPYGTVNGVVYRFSDLRVSVLAGSQLELAVSQAGWYLAVTGYVLTA